MGKIALNCPFLDTYNTYLGVDMAAECIWYYDVFEMMQSWYNILHLDISLDLSFLPRSWVEFHPRVLSYDLRHTAVMKDRNEFGLGSYVRQCQHTTSYWEPSYEQYFTARGRRTRCRSLMSCENHQNSSKGRRSLSSHLFRQIKRFESISTAWRYRR